MSAKLRSDYQRSSSSSERRRKRRPRKRKWPYVIVSLLLITVLGLVASVFLGFNPFLEARLRAQFGDDFFTEFGVLRATGDGEDLKSIIADYEPVFIDLEDQALDRLDNLFARALDEYHQSERDGNLDRFMLTNKYIQAGRILEKNVDTIFYALLDEMKAELDAKSLSTAVTLEIEETYEKAKADKKRELLDRLRSRIGN